MSTCLTHDEVLKILGVSEKTLQDWREDKLLPHTHRRGYPSLYPEQYIRQLAYLAHNEKSSIKHARLCMLEWRFNGEDKKDAQRAYRELLILEQQQVLCRTHEATQITGYGRGAIIKWMRNGFLPGIKVGKYTFFLRSRVVNVRKIMNGLTTIEVMQELGVSNATVCAWARNGTLSGTETPSGWRFDRNEVKLAATKKKEAQLQTQEQLITSQVMQELGIAPSTVILWIKAGVLNPTMVDGKNYYDPESIQRLRQQQTTLQGGFELLVLSPKEKTYDTKVVARKVGTSPAWVVVWANEGLLPHYVLTPAGMQRVGVRLYLASYVDELVDYAKTLHKKPSRDIARQYKQLRLGQ